MTAPFFAGPFEYRPSRGPKLSGAPHTRWSMRYDGRELAWHHVPADATRAAVVEDFVEDRGVFMRDAKRRAGIAPVVLRDVIEDRAIASFPTWDGVVEGMDSSAPSAIEEELGRRYWLMSPSNPHASGPTTIDEYAALAAKHALPPHAWIASLLPDEVLTHDTSEWRAPTAWEIRHVVGEGSFTGTTGAKAAAVVGVTPQNWRKYTARDDARGRQSISFAMWHLLLHRLDVQRLPW